MEKMTDEQLKKNHSFDQYGRYAVIRDILNANRQHGETFKVLDVGGRGNIMRRFLSKDAVYYLDPLVDTEDVNFIEGDGCAIPLESDSFDWVVSADVFEHIPSEKRKDFLNENIRVAKMGVVLAAPFFSQEIEQAEVNANENYKILFGKGNDTLEEHIKNTLPTENFIENIINDKGCAYQKISNNNLFLWELYIGSVVNFSAWNHASTLSNFEELNLFYNTSIFPADFSQPSYRKIYLIKKKAGLLDLLVDTNEITPELFLEAIKRWVDFVNKTNKSLISLEKKKIRFDAKNKIDQKNQGIQAKEDEIAVKNQVIQVREDEIALKNQVIQEKEREIEFIKSSKFWKFRERYVKLKGLNPKYFFVLAKKALFVLRNDGVLIFIESFYKYIVHGRTYFRSTIQYPDNTYALWIKKNEQFDLQKIREEMSRFQFKPKISIITPVYNVDSKWLDKCIQSVVNQFYENWELCLHDDASTNKETIKCLKKWGKKDARIKISFGKDNQHISGASNDAIKIATGEFIALLDNDDELAPNALYENVKYLNIDSKIDFIYSDEDKMDTDNIRSNPFFKPDWSPELFCSVNYICHFSLMRKKIGDNIGWFRKGVEGAQDFDLFLRFFAKTKNIKHITKILYHWRMLETSTAKSIGSKNYANDAGKKALADFVKENNINATVEDGYGETNYRLKFEIPENKLISIIIPFKDKVDILKTCIESIIDKTIYKNYEIVLISNNSVEKATFDYLKEVKNSERVRIFERNVPFNFSAINNWAVSKALGEYILFLNNDTEVISEDWLGGMLMHAHRKEVGAVGALLLYPNKTIQHAGVIMGMTGLAGHVFSKQKEDESYYNMANYTRNYLAVTAACLMISKKKFLEVGGFNELFTVCGNDVNLCLDLYEKGYLNVYTPYAKLYHHESLTRDKLPPKCDMDISNKRYVPYIGKDPYYNVNLSLEHEIITINTK